MDELYVYLKPLVLTILFEGTAAYILGLKSPKQQLLVMLVNVMTNPLLVCSSLFLIYHLGIAKGTVLTYAILEPVVVAAEYLVYRSCLEGRNCFVLSLLLNAISVIGGILCQGIMH